MLKLVGRSAAHGYALFLALVNNGLQELSISGIDLIMRYTLRLKALRS
jgi:hypothetical protein